MPCAGYMHDIGLSHSQFCFFCTIVCTISPLPLIMSSLNSFLEHDSKEKPAKPLTKTDPSIGRTDYSYFYHTLFSIPAS